jgi:hypothetical protein
MVHAMNNMSPCTLKASDILKSIYSSVHILRTRPAHQRGVSLLLLLLLPLLCTACALLNHTNTPHALLGAPIPSAILCAEVCTSLHLVYGWPTPRRQSTGFFFFKIQEVVWCRSRHALCCCRTLCGVALLKASQRALKS